MWIWFGVGLFFLGIEALSFGLISIWFAIGAFTAMFFTHLELNYQLYIFVVVSGLSMLFIRKIAVKYLHRKSKVLDRITDQIVKIENLEFRGENKIYHVRLDGKQWEAKSLYDFEIGDLAKVEKIEGNKLCLKK